MTPEGDGSIDAYLDLGPGERWLTPGEAALDIVCLILAKRGMAEARVPEVTRQLATLAGRRFQDDLAIAQVSDREARARLMDASENADTLRAILLADHPRGSLYGDPTVIGMRRLVASGTLGVGRLATIMRRAVERRQEDEGRAGVPFMEAGSALLDAALNEALWALRASPAESSDAELSLYGFAGPLSPIKEAERDALLAYLPLIDRGGRPPSSKALIDLVYRAACVWRNGFGKRPGLTKSASGKLTGAFFDMLARLADAYDWFPSNKLGDSAIAAGLLRIMAEERYG